MSDDKNKFVARVEIPVPVGMSAKEAREIGFEIPAHIPDCATCEERNTFAWINLVLDINNQKGTPE